MAIELTGITSMKLLKNSQFLEAILQLSASFSLSVEDMHVLIKNTMALKTDMSSDEDNKYLCDALDNIRAYLEERIAEEHHYSILNQEPDDDAIYGE